MSGAAEVSVAAGEERRCWSAIVCALTALQRPIGPDSVTQDSQRKDPCVLGLEQSGAAGPDPHLDAQLDSQLSQEDTQRGQRDNTRGDPSRWALLTAGRICNMF